MSTTTATPTLTARQLWGQINTKDEGEGGRSWCTPIIMPTGGLLIFDDNVTTTLTARATYLLPCDSKESLLSPDTTGNETTIGFSEPFYASISPQIFALATATVISYILVILIFITPRTFYVGGPGGGGGFLSRHGLSGSKNVMSIGRRPLLQKLATLTVAISLTIATADTFAVATQQYYDGYLDSTALVDDVVNTILIRVVRIISDSFLWLAQVQTLIRLFPRHKEKGTSLFIPWVDSSTVLWRVGWLGFALVSADVIFSILDSFISDNPGTRPRSFQDAIPALNYLFELAISLIYASCVVYYMLSKRRFAFWHPKMRNICLVALISFISISIPVVFFVLDISLPKLAGWGEYIRWVGAAAASVVVWEHVERIEALERDERKDGILGREIFDGDEMLGRSSADNGDWHGRGYGGDTGGDVEKSGVLTQHINAIRTKLPLRRRRKKSDGDGDDNEPGSTKSGSREKNGSNPPVPPQPAVSPPSRSDTNSATSTIYAVRYHNLSSPSPAAPEPVPEEPSEDQDAPKDISDSSTEDPIVVKEGGDGQNQTAGNRNQPFWSNVPNPFKRRRAEPPAQVAGAQAASGVRRSPIDRTVNLRGRLGTFAATQRDRLGRNGSGPQQPLPVMVIPAPQNNDRTWSPDDVRISSSISSAGQARQDQAGPSGHSRQPSQPNQNGSTVVTIPAPTASGRTWSPQDQIQTATQTDQPLPARQTETSNNSEEGRSSQTATSTIVSTPRGALTINESSSRPPRRNTYTRKTTQPDSSRQVPLETNTSQGRSSPPATTSNSMNERRVPHQTTASGDDSQQNTSAIPADGMREEAASSSRQDTVEDGRDTGDTPTVEPAGDASGARPVT